MQRRKFITKSSFVIFGWSFYENSIMRSLDSNRSIKEIKQLSVIAPSTIRPNEEFSLHLKFIKDPYFTEWRVVDNFNKSPRGTTFMKNTVDNWSGALEIIADLDLKGRSKYSIGDGENWSNGMGELKGFSFRNPGIKEIQVRDVNNDIVGVSNPILVSDNPINLYWGDLHCHSFFGDGIRSPEELHLFARDEAQFDVFALTEHTDLLTDDQWKYFVNVANRFNQPGKFVSFVGGEWTSSKYGHRGFIYQDIGPIIRTNHPNQNDLQKLFSIVSANNGLVIANHPNWSSYAVKFNEYVDQWSVERLVEIFSTGGIYENSKDQDNGKGDSVIDGLKGGRKLGLIGTGDTHDGRPGDSLAHYQIKPESYKNSKPSGITGIWAYELTRESIFDALWNRRVYGTTNNRTILKFSINGSPMGSSIRPGKSLNAKVEIASPLNINKVEIIKDGTIVKIIQPGEKYILWEVNIINNNSSKATFLYAKASLSNENFVWSSPIWVGAN